MMTKVAFGLAMLLVVACGSIVAESKQSAPAPIGAVVEAQDAVDVEALRQRVAELETRLEEPQWTEADAIAVAQDKLSAAERNCRANKTLSCRQYLSSLIKGMTPGTPGPLANAAVRVLLKGGKWSAVRKDASNRWLVIVVRYFSDGSSFVPFYVYERTGLVEGTVLTTQKVHDDFPREHDVQLVK